jgi:hypothetical protein
MTTPPSSRSGAAAVAGAAESHELVGHRFPDGHLRILPYEDWLARDAIGATTTATRPHGSWTLIGCCFRGMGADLTEIFHVLGAAEEDGALLGESAVKQLRPLEYGRHYTVRSEIVEVKRRHGAKVPVFDLVTFAVALQDELGVAVQCRNSLVVPRRAECTSSQGTSFPT